jgi:tubulin--tyrosine ligase
VISWFPKFAVKFNLYRYTERAAAERVMAAEAGSSAAWVLQRYVADPMLVGGKFKFHLRVMALAVGDLTVYVHDNAVALCAAEPLGVGGSIDLSNKFAHATNHCVQKRHASAEHVEGGVTESNSFSLSELCDAVPLPPAHPTPAALLAHVRAQLRAVVADLFTAARSRAAAAVGFFPLENTFELFGLDFLLDAGGKAWLLEVNADPSLAVFGDRLRPRCAELIRDTLDAALPSVVGKAGGEDGDGGDGGDGCDGDNPPGSSDASDVGGFKRVLELPPRFSDGAEGRRRVSKLMSLMGSLAASTYEGNSGTNERGRNGGDDDNDDGAAAARLARGGVRMASVSLGAPGSAGAAAAL